MTRAISQQSDNSFIFCIPEKEPEIIKDPESNHKGPGIA